MPFVVLNQTNSSESRGLKGLWFDFGRSTELERDPYRGPQRTRMTQQATATLDTCTALLDAAAQVLRERGYSALSTREVPTVGRSPEPKSLPLRFQAGAGAGAVRVPEWTAAASPARCSTTRRFRSPTSGTGPARFSMTTLPRATCAPCTSSRPPAGPTAKSERWCA